MYKLVKNGQIPRNNFPRLNQEKENMNITITRNKIESVIKKFPMKENPQ